MASPLDCFSSQLNAEQAAPREVYVDWQKELGVDDVKDLLMKQLRVSRESGLWTELLLTGQKGCGKSTELRRVQERLTAEGVFVSFEDGAFVERLGPEITAGDILYFAAERLVADLVAKGITSAGAAWQGFWKPLAGALKNLGVEMKGPMGVGIGLSLKNETTRRTELRQLFEAHRYRFLELLNKDVIAPARERLAEVGIEGLVLIVDGLGDIEPVVATDPLLGSRSNLERIFIDQGDILTRV